MIGCGDGGRLGGRFGQAADARVDRRELVGERCRRVAIGIDGVCCDGVGAVGCHPPVTAMTTTSSTEPPLFRAVPLDFAKARRDKRPAILVGVRRRSAQVEFF